LLVSLNFLQTHNDVIQDLCKQYNVKSLQAFGSVITDHLGNDSDIDLLVDFEDSDPLDYSEKYFGLKFQLEAILKRNVDLLEHRALSNHFLRNQIERTAVLVYGAKN